MNIFLFASCMPVRRAGFILSLAALAGCASLPSSNPVLAVHDFGSLEAASLDPGGIPLRGVEVVPAPWLASNVMIYRLAYADATRRQAYKDSRWAAQPAQLVELVLKRSLRAGDSMASAGGCRLRVDLDEFAQLFDTPRASRGVIEVRAALLAPRSDQPLVLRAFSIDHEAATPDAAGGVAALRSGTLRLKDEIRAWLQSLESVARGPADSLRARCGA